MSTVKFVSTDGTHIASERRGRGAPLVLVHGTSASAARWSTVLPELELRFTVYAIDRRGYGASGDGLGYSIEREFADIAAVVDEIGGPVNLLGHSFGALCCLGAARLTANIGRLILYEPALRLSSASLYPPDAIARMQARLEAGDRDGVLAILFRELAAMTPEEFDSLRALPSWPARLSSAHAVLRETLAEEQYLFRSEQFRTISAPTLLLLGGDSPPFLRDATEAIAAALRNSRIDVLPGQRHIAMFTAPVLFASKVTDFLDEPDRN